ncbi:coniferyl aldehyde dehydrogenase [Phyllobacterium sp. YR531]|uniref:coniferyl aldehyde dehydrogenase n=1 Tax=Phyllobacterium sp. YR531 TaxID=1144343 RepID=UPI00026F7DFB|nr:coniferyl aldehyde dehydrogenase [Phyllobacterium sp. YR531]EJN06332.1 NAD-dependent aldehyde dehydrogenase [Phyllobacterium sp. YR531]
MKSNTPAIDQMSMTLAELRTAWLSNRPDYEQRYDDLKRLRSALKDRLELMVDVISADFGHRSRHESLLGEGMTVFSEIDHMLSHLKSWMKPEKRSAGWRMWPAKAEVRYVPVGVVGVISPWNYPVNLALTPLATAIAAGNHVYLKPSEHTPRTSEFLAALLADVFPASRVAVALGGPEVGGAFAGLAFDHLLFTGSTAVGKKVMAAAAPNLTPVTLELGGKSPVFLGETAPVKKAVTRLITGKLYNAGQTCIAPDYALVPHARKDEFVEAVRREVTSRYTQIDTTPDYTHIVNEGQYRRLRSLLDDAVNRGHEVITLAEPRDAGAAEIKRLLPPTLVLNPSDDSRIMQEEIFGPILPIKTYTTVDEAIDYINAHERPLAFYCFSDDKFETEKLLSNIVAGGVCVNETLLHIVCNDLPFGGVGASGMGHYHGREGFRTFSKAMPVLHQARMPLSDRLKPPYKGLANLIVRLFVR